MWERRTLLTSVKRQLRKCRSHSGPLGNMERGCAGSPQLSLAGWSGALHLRIPEFQLGLPRELKHWTRPCCLDHGMSRKPEPGCSGLSQVPVPGI